MKGIEGGLERTCWRSKRTDSLRQGGEILPRRHLQVMHGRCNGYLNGQLPRGAGISRPLAFGIELADNRLPLSEAYDHALHHPRRRPHPLA
jgi:hypothetical protein